MRWLPTLILSVLAFTAAYYWWDGASTSVQAGYAERKADSVSTEALAPIQPAMEVASAYSAIPHQRTTFRDYEAVMPPGEAVYLAALFQLTDLAVAERVSLQNSLWQGRGVDVDAGNHAKILARIRGLDTPAGLLPVESLIHQAIDEQRAYLSRWAEEGDRRFFKPSADLVQRSHGKLISAYRLLIQRYGEEPAHNRQSFFDHLCALDFI